MSAANDSPHKRGGDEVNLDDLAHPRGTLVIVIVFGALFGLAWFATYVFLFLGRGALHS